MTYTKLGPFVDGGAPYLSAATFDHIEDGLTDSSFGVTAPLPTGVAATDTANLQNAITTAQNASQDLLLHQGEYVLNAGLTWNAARGSIIGAGNTDLDFTALTSGAALTIIGAGTGASGYYSHRAWTNRIAGIRMNGPDTDTTTVDGILITDTSTAVDGVTLERMLILGFRDGLTYGTNTWLVNHLQVAVGSCHRYGINLTQGTNAGEAMHFFGCVAFNCVNASGTAIGIYAPPDGPFADHFFFGGSIDYNDNGADLNGHHIAFHGTHFEDRNSVPMVQTANTSGQAPTDVSFTGCTFADTTAAPGRTALVTTKAGSSASVHLTVNGGTGGKYGNSTRFYDDLSGNSIPPTVLLNGFSFDQGGATDGGQYGNYFNDLVNGDFETSTGFVTAGVAGWTAGTSFTWTIGTANPHRGTHAARVTGTGTTATDLTYQKVLLPGRRPISLTGYINCSSWTAGVVSLNYTFYASDGTTSLAAARIGATVGAITAGWTFRGQRLLPPAGAVYLRVELVAVNWNGTADFDDIHVVAL